MTDHFTDPTERLILAMAGHRACGTCARSWDRSDAPGRVSCGAAYEDGPIWAERKYGRDRLVAILAGGEDPAQAEGIDCENMAMGDGGACKAWEPRTK